MNRVAESRLKRLILAWNGVLTVRADILYISLNSIFLICFHLTWLESAIWICISEYHFNRELSADATIPYARQTPLVNWATVNVHVLFTHPLLFHHVSTSSKMCSVRLLKTKAFHSFNTVTERNNETQSIEWMHWFTCGTARPLESSVACTKPNVSRLANNRRIIL